MKRNRILLCIFALLLLSNGANAQVYDTLSPFGAYWKYLDDGTSQDATAWKTTTFSDASWACAPAPLGFGDSWIVGCIHSGCSANIECYPTCTTITITDYFRRKFSVTNPSIYDSVFMDGIVDDGMVLYVNGTQAWSYGMPSTWTYTTTSSNSISGTTETQIIHQGMPIASWVAGNNFVAAELHQRAPNTSDATFDVRFRFRRKSTGLSVAHTSITTANQFSVYPNPSDGNITIESKDPAFAGEQVNMSVFDVTGRKVAEQAVRFADTKANVQLPLTGGMYFVRLALNGTNATFRINIEK